MQETRNTRVQHQKNRKKQNIRRLFVAAVILLLVVCVVWISRPGTVQEETPATGPAVSGVEPTTNDGDGDKQQEPQIPVLPEEESWKIILVNSSHALPDGYVPEMTTVDNTSFQFDIRAAEDLNAMLRDARAEGLSPMICSSYRTWERQTTLFEKQVEKQQATGLSYEDAYEKAKTVVAYPGTSEHQTGLTADIVATSHQLLDDSQADTAEQQWLMANCCKYGFILRYPLGKSEETGIIYEPWHYRYVGHEVAQYITENGLCLEEYWQQLEALQQA